MRFPLLQNISDRNTEPDPSVERVMQCQPTAAKRFDLCDCGNSNLKALYTGMITLICGASLIVPQAFRLAKVRNTIFMSIVSPQENKENSVSLKVLCF